MSRKLFCSFSIFFFNIVLKKFLLRERFVGSILKYINFNNFINCPSLIDRRQEQNKYCITNLNSSKKQKKGQQLIKPKQQLFIQFSWQVIYQFIYLYFKVGQMNFSPQTFQGFGFCLFFLVFSFFFFTFCYVALNISLIVEREKEKGEFILKINLNYKIINQKKEKNQKVRSNECFSVKVGEINLAINLNYKITKLKKKEGRNKNGNEYFKLEAEKKLSQTF
eukprot:TRINITY_DN874_c0_g1_i1.p1 TRINITY_DN874_c0_g1~~TRINITY_DN874_c0_g1_i1.p1  ORF type:complete len:222 (-),score=19.89 TRINITY_DN874_c0_g1_i1:259-924(-)